MGGIKKEYRVLDDSLTVLGKAVSAFARNPLIQTIVITVPENGESAAREALPPGILTAQPEILFVQGGRTRSDSVFNALSLLAEYNPHYVLIHDGLLSVLLKR
jgi:2-C-methyl-D-erythritol 4-phosphate cytidylyltransferase/2-C-methyl-D-erythritol 4-phosphate cytidylyltransferase/2-C-methyl-D-erythritol 2,4-cyclodiphosphate synthase